MPIKKQDSRILIKRSTSTSVVPTIPVTNDHTDGSWLITDLYKGEFFINLFDGLAWFRGDGGVVKISGSSTYALSGLINNSNNTFTTSTAFDSSKILIFLNGIKQKIIEDYTVLNSTTISFNVSPQVGDKIEAQF